MTAAELPPTRPFDVDEALDLVGEAIRPYPKAAMFELRDRGYGTVFQQLVACVLSIRTRDEESLPAALGLFAAAPTPEAIAALSRDDLIPLLGRTSFPGDKAATILLLARAALDAGGDLPADADALIALKGIGPKCAHLALGVARNIPVIAVDVHVWRIANRWGYVAATTPEKALAQLEAKLPDRWKVESNARLVPFGKHVCTGLRPKCPACPLREMCPKIGVDRVA